MHSMNLSRYSPQALGILRIVTALLYGEHGTQKLLNFPAMMQFGGGGGGGGGPGGAGGPPGGGGLPTLFLIGGIIELFGGLAILIGLFTRPIAFILAGELAVIYWLMHVPRGGMFPVSNGGEAAIMFCFTMLYLVFAGPGAFSVDGMLAARKAKAA
jgi:putative oxidoreductase